MANVVFYIHVTKFPYKYMGILWAAEGPILPWATRNSLLAKGKIYIVFVVFTSLCGSICIYYRWAQGRDEMSASNAKLFAFNRKGIFIL